MIRYRRDLWELVKDVPGDLAEIGVAEGNFSRDMLAWQLVDAPKLYLVDRWACVPDAKGDSANPQPWHDRNLESAKMLTYPWLGRTEFLKGESVEMAERVPEGSLRLVYIDADHSFDAVLRDLRAWKPKLGPGGVMAFHDYLNTGYGVRLAVDKCCQDLGLTVNVIAEDKDEDAGAWFRV